MAQRPVNARLTFDDLTAVELHIALQGVSPMIWRRLVVPLGVTLAQLHPILQAAMGWSDVHLHRFEVGGLMYGDTDRLNTEKSERDRLAFDAYEVRLRDFAYEPGTAFGYVYDFGDNWRHTVILERVLARRPAPTVAICVAGARACPPEDVGGATGYAEFLRVFTKPEDRDLVRRRDLVRWAGGKFDPEAFDLAKADAAVRRALKQRPY